MEIPILGARFSRLSLAPERYLVVLSRYSSLDGLHIVQTSRSHHSWPGYILPSYSPNPAMKLLGLASCGAFLILPHVNCVTSLLYLIISYLLSTAREYPLNRKVMSS